MKWIIIWLVILTLLAAYAPFSLLVLNRMPWMY